MSDLVHQSDCEGVRHAYLDCACDCKPDIYLADDELARAIDEGYKKILDNWQTDMRKDNEVWVLHSDGKVDKEA